MKAVVYILLSVAAAKVVLWAGERAQETHWAAVRGRLAAVYAEAYYQGCISGDRIGQYTTCLQRAESYGREFYKSTSLRSYEEAANESVR